MSEAIVLDTPEGITMWVLLSRRAQVKMQRRGIKTPGLVKWVRENLGTDYPHPIRTAKDCVVPVEYAISAAGGDVDYSLVNIHVMERIRPDVFQDLGVYNSPDDISPTSYLARRYSEGMLEIVLTLDEPRPASGNLYTSA